MKKTSPKNGVPAIYGTPHFDSDGIFDPDETGVFS